MSEHTMPPGPIHHAWDRSLEPVLTVASGDTVHYDIPMAGEGQVSYGCDYAETNFDFATTYNLAGPLEVQGSQPGDVVQVEILSLEPGEWGWTAIMPGLGLLPDDFPDGYVRTFELVPGMPVTFADGIALPQAPFFGTMGNPLDIDGVHLPFPPHAGGGNMDNRHLTTGSTVWLPVHCAGALFSVGDPHAMQGDGEVCVSALECPMRASLRFTVLSDGPAVPSFRTSHALTSQVDAAGHYGTMGIADDLMEGARSAVRAMITWLGHQHDLSPQDAYMLCSLVGDLKILEIVDAGMWNVAMTVPLSIFA